MLDWVKGHGPLQATPRPTRRRRHQWLPWLFRGLQSTVTFDPLRRAFGLLGWLRGTVVERRSLAGELSLSHARLAADA